MTALIMKTLPTLPMADREASNNSLATLDQSALSVTGDTDATVVYPSLMLAIMSSLAPEEEHQCNIDFVGSKK